MHKKRSLWASWDTLDGAWRAPSCQGGGQAPQPDSDGDAISDFLQAEPEDHLGLSLATGPPHPTASLCDRRECIHKVSIEAREVQNGASKPPISASPDPSLLPPSYHSITGDSWLNREKTHSRERTREGRTHCKSSANKNTEPRGSRRIFLNPACRELLLNQLERTQERNPIGHPRNGQQNALGFSRPEFKWDPITCVISDKIVHLHLEFLHL